MPSDHQRTRHELIQEVVALRKQVADLRQAAHDRRRIEEALRESEARYRAWLEELPVATARIGPDGRVAGANDALAHLLGYDSRHELLELAPVLGLWGSREEEIRLSAFLRESHPFHADLTLRAKDGDAVPAVVRVRPIRGGEEWAVTIAPRLAPIGVDP